MPPLACTVQKLPDLVVAELPKGYFAPSSYEYNAVVQHLYEGFQRRFNTGPKLKPVFKQDEDHAWKMVSTASIQSKNAS
jgi:hypothetical protein